jgi:HEPN domain
VPADPAEEARTWFTQATEDLSAARHMASNADMPPRLAAFLAHLAAEKALKATLIAHGVAIRQPICRMLTRRRLTSHWT